jgi:hypothetical protein
MQKRKLPNEAIAFSAPVQGSEFKVPSLQELRNEPMENHKVMNGTKSYGFYQTKPFRTFVSFVSSWFTRKITKRTQLAPVHLRAPILCWRFSVAR